MENASKALIIAGAILISILLISVGIIVMNAVNKPAGEVDRISGSQTIEIFNSNFTSYIGNRVSANSVKQLFSTVASSNVGLTSSDTRYITVQTGTGYISDIADVNSSKTYTVKITDTKPASSLDGFYDTVTITEN